MALTPNSLPDVLRDPKQRNAIAADAVREAEAAVRERRGPGGLAARLGLETINRLRPGFLQRHVHAMLPGWAELLDPHWQRSQASHDVVGHFETHANTIAEELLSVSDTYVARAKDAKAIAAYYHLRPRAPARIAEQMPRVAAFLQRHTP